MDIIIVTKVVVAILFGVSRFIFGILPIYVCTWINIDKQENENETLNLEKRKKLEFWVALVQSFGGGVLFATCFLHMMPEVYHSVQVLKEHGKIDADYPFSQLIISFGFFLIYFIEEISHWLLSCMPMEFFKKKLKTRTTSNVSIISKENKITPKSIQDQQDHQSEEADELKLKQAEDAEVKTENLRDLDDTPEINAELEQIIEEEVKTQTQILRCILIVLALSFHAIIEGLAIGLQNSVKNIWYLFIAISVHSSTILFCIGLEIVLAGGKSKTIVIHMLLLAVTSPVGIVLGITIGLTTGVHENETSIIVVLLEGVSAGTILYITFFEVLSREKDRRTFRLRRSLCIGVGFGLMAALECINFA